MFSTHWKSRGNLFQELVEKNVSLQPCFIVKKKYNHACHLFSECTCYLFYVSIILQNIDQLMICKVNVHKYIERRDGC